MTFRTWFDIGLLVLASAILIVNLRALKRNRLRVGCVQASWRARFDFDSAEGWFRMALLLVLGAAAVLWLGSDPHPLKWLDGMSFICLGLAFIPRYNFVAVGTEGILDRSVFIPWESVWDKRVVEERGRRHLELRLRAEPGSRASSRLIRIRVPRDVSLILD